MDNGWISLHRTLSDHWLWKDEKFTKGQAWVDLILHANHSNTKAMIKGQLFDVRKGQQLRSKLTLSKLWKWDRKTVTRFLSLLEKDRMITQQTTHQTTIITICNYSDFQDTRKQKGQQTGQQKGQASPNGRDIDNNDNNDNNKKKGVKRFTPPSLDELKAYILEKQYDIDGQYFIDFYDSKGWMIGKNKMKDWKATVRGWHSRNKKGNNNGNGQNRKLTQCEQITENERIANEWLAEQDAQSPDGENMERVINPIR